MNQSVLVVGFILLCAGLAALGARLVRRALPRSVVEASIPAAGAIFATFGVIYGVILGQVVVAAWESYDAAESAIASEADSLVSITRLADGLPAAQRDKLQEAAIAYGTTVIEQEWPVMQAHGGASPAASAAIDNLYRIITQLPGDTPQTDAIADAALGELDTLDDARGDRIVASTRGMPLLMWITLIIGGILSVAFTFLLAVENGWLHVAMVISLTGLIAMMLVLVRGLSQPFSNPIGISPDSYTTRLALMEHESRS
ncbi:MAG: hypothetical protein ACR2J8_05390 [Thermomicrobiales bacterium]